MLNHQTRPGGIFYCKNEIIKQRKDEMKNIILGLKDYLKDTMHDFVLHIKSSRYFMKLVQKINPEAYDWFFWKEGNLKHYISQRKVAKK
jgi:hypothetical protein